MSYKKLDKQYNYADPNAPIPPSPELGAASPPFLGKRDSADSLSGSPPPYEPVLGEAMGDFDYGVTVESSSIAIRMAFVRKVYSILAVQIGATMAACATFMYSPTIAFWAYTNTWMLWVSFLGALGTLVALMWKRRSYPMNYILLSVFTVLEAYAIGMTCAAFQSEIVLQAAILTFSMFVGLTLFACQTKYDFSSLGPYLVGSLWVLVLGGFLFIFFPSSGFNLALGIVGVLLFSGFIVYDTQMIFTRLSPEDYIVAAVELYLDFLNLFISILRILSYFQQGRD